MVEPKQGRLSSNLTPVTTPSGTQPARASGGWLWIIGLIGLILVVKCSSTPSTSGNASTVAAGATNDAQTALGSAVATQSPPPVEALSRSSAGLGATRVNLAAREGLAGEMIYSQNCYDALSRQFSWGKLDQCGGFDVEASKASADDETLGASAAETAWFDEEAAAGRYLKAATAAGEAAEDADKRLAALQAQIARRHPVKIEAPSEPVNTDEEPPGDAVVNAEAK